MQNDTSPVEPASLHAMTRTGLTPLRLFRRENLRDYVAERAQTTHVERDVVIELERRMQVHLDTILDELAATVDRDFTIRAQMGLRHERRQIHLGHLPSDILKGAAPPRAERAPQFHAREVNDEGNSLEVV